MPIRPDVLFVLCKYSYTQTIVLLAFCLLKLCSLRSYVYNSVNLNLTFYKRVFFLSLKLFLTVKYNYIILL